MTPINQTQSPQGPQFVQKSKLGEIEIIKNKIKQMSKNCLKYDSFEKNLIDIPRYKKVLDHQIQRKNRNQ